MQIRVRRDEKNKKEKRSGAKITSQDEKTKTKRK
jgi:hypothetical protein